MSGKFDRCVSLVIESEGGYVNHPKDLGGDDRERLWGDDLCHPDHKWGRKADIWRWLHAAQLAALSPCLMQGLLPMIELEPGPAPGFFMRRGVRIMNDPSANGLIAYLQALWGAAAT